MGHSGGFHKATNSLRGNAASNDRRPPVAVDGDYGWPEEEDTSSSTTAAAATKTTAVPAKNSLPPAVKGKVSGAAATSAPNGTTTVHDQRPSIDRDSNSSAEGANVRRRRRTKISNNYTQASRCLYICI